MFSHVQSIFGRKPKRAGVIDVTAQCKTIPFATGAGANTQVAEIIASVKEPVFVEFIGYVEQAFDLGSILVGTTSGGTQIMDVADVAEGAIGFTAVFRRWYTAKTKIWVAHTGGATVGKFRLFITAKGTDNRGN